MDSDSGMGMDSDICRDFDIGFTPYIRLDGSVLVLSAPPVGDKQQNLENLRRNHLAPISSASPSIPCALRSAVFKEHSDVFPQKPLSR
jgi:hypothetical protein